MKRLASMQATVTRGLEWIITSKLKQLLKDCEVVVTILVRPEKYSEYRVCDRCDVLIRPNGKHECSNKK